MAPGLPGGTRFPTSPATGTVEAAASFGAAPGGGVAKLGSHWARPLEVPACWLGSLTLALWRTWPVRPAGPAHSLCPCALQYSPQCEPGCVCPPGLVADGSGGCVAAEDCPCVHNGASYRPGETIWAGCNTWWVAQSRAGLLVRSREGPGTAGRARRARVLGGLWASVGLLGLPPGEGRLRGSRGSCRAPGGALA